MKRVACIKNARLRGRRATADLWIDEEGRISRIGPRSRWSRSDIVLDARGNLVVPSFVDAHLHLDLAYTLDLVPPNRSGTLGEAIALWSRYKRRVTARDVESRARRAIDAEIGFGTGFIRTHVDVATASGMRLCEGVLAARERCRDRIDIQVVAFPQDGLLRDPGALEQLREAMRMGCDAVGGIAHNERTPEDSRRHIDLIFEVAEDFDRPIDCHIDETDDAQSRCTEYLAAQTTVRGWQGRVTASHVCALAGYDEAYAAKVIALMAEAKLGVVTNPGVNLHLQGRYDRYPKRRGLTRVRQLRAAGIKVAAGQDCIRDPFYPLGTGQMLEAAHLLVHADHMSTPPDIEAAFDAVGPAAAQVLDVKGYGIAVGRFADLCVLPAPDVHEAIRTRPRPIWVLKRGRLFVGATNNS